MKRQDIDVQLDDEFDALNLCLKPIVSDEELLSKKYQAKAHVRKVVEELRKDDVEGLEKGLIFLPGEPTRLYEDSDQGPDFRQRRYFYYITGVDFADCAVTYEIANDRLALWIPYIEPRQSLWFGSLPDAARAEQLYDVDEVHYSKELAKFLQVNLNESTTLFLISSQQAPQTPQFHEASSNKPKIDTVNLKAAMDRARLYKDSQEIALIRKANAISSIAHRETGRSLLRLRNEQEIEAIFQAGCTARGAHSQAYHIIAGAGENAATLHYFANDQPLKGRELLVLDAGCEFKNYCSDITRTLPISGKFSKESGAIHDLVQKMQNECIEAMEPGREFFDVHLLAASIGLDGLIELGILKGDRDELAGSRVITAFFPHGLGHHVGLDVHDVTGGERLLHASKRPRLESGKRELIARIDLAPHNMSRNGNRQTMAPGMIITVEPGIYFNREYIEGYFLSNPDLAKFFDVDVLERYYYVGGVRIEDDILITQDGYENLSSAPKGKDLLDVINSDFELV